VFDDKGNELRPLLVDTRQHPEDAVFSERRLLNNVFYKSGELHAYEPVGRIPKHLTVVIEHHVNTKQRRSFVPCQVSFMDNSLITLSSLTMTLVPKCSVPSLIQMKSNRHNPFQIATPFKLLTISI
jgi:hypothetical protein